MMTFNQLNEKAVESILNISEDTKEQLKNIDDLKFDIFKVQETTNQNELVTVVTMIFAKEKLFDKLPIRNDKFLNFIKKV